MVRQPTQERAQATYNRLLDAAGALLAEVGVERISTNMVAARAGVTPPTLYHYFANKYALLAALGERLMQAQNALIILDLRQAEAVLAKALIEHVELTRAMPGGPWIMRMLRAVPQLSEVRLASHRLLTAKLVAQALADNPDQDEAALNRRVRLCVELGYAAIELVFDEPDIDCATLMMETASAIRTIVVGDASRSAEGLAR